MGFLVVGRMVWFGLGLEDMCAVWLSVFTSVCMSVDAHVCVYACVCRCEFKHVQGQMTSYVYISCFLKSIPTFLKQDLTLNLELALSS